MAALELRKVIVLLVVGVIVVITFLNQSRGPTRISSRSVHHSALAAGAAQLDVPSSLSKVKLPSDESEPRWLKRMLDRENEKGGPSLPKEVVKGVKKFLLFVGYPRSGHSILGSFIDAHPHVAIAHEMMLMRIWKDLSNRQKKTGIANPFFKDQAYLFNVVYRQSYWDAKSSRSEQSAEKNYTLSVDSPWQGKYNKYLNVIGDKSGGMTTIVYLSSARDFPRYLNELKETVKVPIKIIHAVRNPFDLASTQLLYKDSNHLPLDNHQGKVKVKVSAYKSAMNDLEAQGDMEAFEDAKHKTDKLEYTVRNLIKKVEAVTKIGDLVGWDNVLEVHNMDLVNNPKDTMSKVCAYLELDCSPEYLQACADKVFGSVSKTRNIVTWTPKLKNMVEKELIQKYSFFSRYSFESD